MLSAQQKGELGKKTRNSKGDQSLSDQLSGLLASRGYHVVQRYEGDQALITAMGQRLDLILLDVLLPRMNGFEFLAEFNLLDLEPRPHVIVFSGMTLDDSLRETLMDLHAGLIDKNEEGVAQKLRQMTKSLVRKAS